MQKMGLSKLKKTRDLTRLRMISIDLLDVAIQIQVLNSAVEDIAKQITEEIQHAEK